MRAAPVLAVALLLAVVAPAGAQTGPSGFSAAVAVGSGFVGNGLAGSVGPGARAALAWVTPAADLLAVRGVAATGAWGANEIVRPPAAGVTLRDVQVAQGDETAVAWEEIDHGRYRVMAAIAPPGRPFAAPEVVAETHGFRAATPRLVATASGRFVLAWHDAHVGRRRVGPLRYALCADGRTFGPARVFAEAGRDPALVAAADGAVVAAWRTPRRVLAARLAPHARGFAPPALVSRSTASGPRLASGPGGTVMVSWTTRAGSLFTRGIRPWAPAQLVARTPGRLSAAALAVGPDRTAIAAFWGVVTTGGPPAPPRVWGATGGVAARWSGLAPLDDAVHPITASVRAAITAGGDGLVVWVQAVAEAVQPAYEVVVAWRPRGAAGFEEPVRLGPGPALVQAGTVLARGGGTIVAAWPSAAGGLLVATRPDR